MKKYKHNIEDIRYILKGIKLSECIDTEYDSSIGEWYVIINCEPYCDIPHFHIVNETLKFDCRIELFRPVYIDNRYKLTNQQVKVLNEWLDMNWKLICLYWDTGFNKLDNWKDPNTIEKPNFNNIYTKEEYKCIKK